jgi:hypothetical protein
MAAGHDSSALDGSPVGDNSIFGNISDSAEGAFDISHTFDPAFDMGAQFNGQANFAAAPPDPPGGRRLGGYTESGPLELPPRKFADGSDARLS